MRILPPFLILLCPIATAALSWTFLNYYPEYGAFCVQLLAAIVTLCAVLIALYGSYLRSLIDPTILEIELCEETDNFLNSQLHNNQIVHFVAHHLRVTNKTPHHTIKDCQVWLTQIHDKQADGTFKKNFTFAVPRLMEWAPSEYSKDKRSFSDFQIFDLGGTGNNGEGFILRYYGSQGGAFSGHCAINHTRRYFFRISAEAYICTKEHVVEVAVPGSAQGIYAPATISVLKNSEQGAAANP